MDLLFPVTGAPTLRGCQHTISPNFPKHRKKSRKFWSIGGALKIDQWLVFQNILWRLCMRITIKMLSFCFINDIKLSLKWPCQGQLIIYDRQIKTFSYFCVLQIWSSLVTKLSFSSRCFSEYKTPLKSYTKHKPTHWKHNLLLFLTKSILNEFLCSFFDTDF